MSKSLRVDGVCLFLIFNSFFYRFILVDIKGYIDLYFFSKSFIVEPLFTLVPLFWEFKHFAACDGIHELINVWCSAFFPFPLASHFFCLSFLLRMGLTVISWFSYSKYGSYMALIKLFSIIGFLLLW